MYFGICFENTLVSMCGFQIQWHIMIWYDVLSTRKFAALRLQVHTSKQWMKSSVRLKPRSQFLLLSVFRLATLSWKPMTREEFQGERFNSETVHRWSSRFHVYFGDIIPATNFRLDRILCWVLIKFKKRLWFWTRRHGRSHSDHGFIYFSSNLKLSKF